MSEPSDQAHLERAFAPLEPQAEPTLDELKQLFADAKEAMEKNPTTVVAALLKENKRLQAELEQAKVNIKGLHSAVAHEQERTEVALVSHANMKARLATAEAELEQAKGAYHAEIKSHQRTETLRRDLESRLSKAESGLKLAMAIMDDDDKEVLARLATAEADVITWAKKAADANRECRDLREAIDKAKGAQ